MRLEFIEAVKRLEFDSRVVSILYARRGRACANGQCLHLYVISTFTCRDTALHTRDPCHVLPIEVHVRVARTRLEVESSYATNHGYKDDNLVERMPVRLTAECRRTATRVEHCHVCTSYAESRTLMLSESEF
jgi:hypothetical protein